MATEIKISGPSANEVLPAIEQELSAFDAWFTLPLSDGGLGNDPLLPLERALLKTYLLARLSGRFSPPEAS
jgi:hypothetical protein